MPSPGPTWMPGPLSRSMEDRIRTPPWIDNMIEKDARPFAETCYREGFYAGYDISSEQYLKAKLRDTLRHLLRHHKDLRRLDAKRAANEIARTLDRIVQAQSREDEPRRVERDLETEGGEFSVRPAPDRD